LLGFTHLKRAQDGGYTEPNRQKWFRHVKRMDKHTEYLKRILDMKMSGRRPMARPRTQMLHKVKRDTEIRRRSWGKVEEMHKWTDRDS
jgi:hypothetical protein